MGTTALAKAFIDAVLAEMASTIFALTGHTASVAAGTTASDSAWIVTLSVSGGRKGKSTLALDTAGTEALTRSVVGPDAEISPTTVTGLVRELVVQAVGALDRRSPFSGVSVAVDTIESGMPPRDAGATFTIAFGDQGRLQVSATADIEAPSAPAVMRAAPEGLVTAAPTSNWDVVLDIDLPLRVRFGSTEMSIRALSALGPGSLVDMGRAPDDPVELLVCGRVIARAEVVVVDGNYGVRVIDLLSAAERVRALEGQL